MALSISTENVQGAQGGRNHGYILGKLLRKECIRGLDVDPCSPMPGSMPSKNQRCGLALCLVFLQRDEFDYLLTQCVGKQVEYGT